MIKRAGEAKQMPCVMKLDNWGGSCGAHECLAWEFWIDPRDLQGEKGFHGKTGHGKKDMEKAGFCGAIKR